MSFVEESADHRLFIAAALLEDGEIRHVHRKLFLPTYGLFDERRFFAAGDVLRAVPSRLGVGIGIAVCEDFWHLPVPQLLALDGAQILINVSSSPGRDLAATNEVGLGTATSWRTLMRTYAQLTTSFVVFCNRVGVDESISFWGGSEVIAPTGQALFSAPLYDEGLFTVDIAPADIRRERIALPLLRDERPELQRPRAAADRRRAGRPGRRHDRRTRAPSRASTSRPAEPPSEPIGFRAAARQPDAPDRRDRGRMTRGATRPPSAPFELPAELAIDTDVARRVIAEFIRGQLEQAGFERAVLGLSGGIDSALVAYLVAEAIGAGAAARGHDAVPDARRRRRARTPSRSSPALGLRERARRDHGRWSTATSGPATTPGASGPEGLEASPLRRGNFAARMRMAVLYDRSVTWGGLVVGTGNKTESLIGYTTLFGDSACAFNPIGDLYKSQVRQLAVALGVPDAIVRKAPSADLWPGQTDETEGGFSYPVLDRLLFWRIDKRRSIDEMVGARLRRRRWSSGSTGWSRAPSSSARSRRSPSSGRGRPASTTSIRAAGRGRRAGDRGRRRGDGRRGRRDAVRRRDADREPRRHHAAGARGPAGRAAHRGRGHAPHAPAARPPRDRDADDQLPRPERRRTRPTALLEHLRGGADLALVTDAGTPAVSDPGGELVAAWAAEGGRVVPIPGASAVLAAVAASGVAGPRWAFEGFLPRSGRERRERLARIAADERGTVAVRGAGPGRGDAARPRRRRAAATGPAPSAAS